jgi:hypothetical protein
LLVGGLAAVARMGMVCIRRRTQVLALGAVLAGCGGGSGDAGTDGPVPVAPDAAPTQGMPPVPLPMPISIKTFARAPDPATSQLANATLVAFADGEGAPWVALAGTGGVYRASVSLEKYAVAVGCAGDLTSDVTVYYQSVTDTTDLAIAGCDPAPPAIAHLAVELTGVTGADNTEAWMGGTPVAGVGGTPLELDVARGLTDVFALSYVRGSSPRVPLKLYRVPGTLDVQAPQTFTIALDSLGLPPETHAVTLTNLDPAETASVHSSYATLHSQVQWPVITEDFAHNPTERWATLAPSMRQANDVSNLTVTASREAADGRLYQRQVRQAMRTPVDVSPALPAPIAVDPPKLARTGTPIATWVIPLAPPTQMAVDYTAALTTSTPDGGGNLVSRGLTVIVRSGWRNPGETVTKLETPDLSGLAGWDTNMALGTGEVSWSLTRSDRNMPTEVPVVDGRLILNSIVSGTLAP